MTKLLIIGAGGYITAVVIPTIKQYFNNIDITIVSKKPANTLTVAAKNDVRALDSLYNIDKFDAYFLACPSVDYEFFLEKIPKNRPIWVEKPIAEATQEHLASVHEYLSKFESNIYVGFNKRAIVEQLDLPKDNIRGKLSMHVDYGPAMNRSLWKQYLIKGGVYYVDGIHMIDLALYLLGQDASIKYTSLADDLWVFDISSTKGEIRVEIGNNARDLVQVNSISNEDFTSSENSLLFFKSNFSKFMNNESNYECCYNNSKKIIGEIEYANT